MALAGPLTKITLAGGAMALSLWLLVMVTAGWSPWLVAPLGMGLGAVVYGLVSLLLGVRESVVLLQQVRRRVRLPQQRK
jgi:hypothetical protein